MSAIDSLTGLNASSQASGDAFSEITSGDFLNIILTEMQSQDPLEPQDTQAILDQLGSLREIESNIALQDNLEALVNQNALASASTLIGSLVSGISTDNRFVFDLVVSVTNTENGPVLNLLDGSRMTLDKVDEIIGPIDGLEEEEDPGDGDGDGDGSGGDGDGGDLDPPIDRPHLPSKGIDRNSAERIADAIEAYRLGLNP